MSFGPNRRCGWLILIFLEILRGAVRRVEMNRSEDGVDELRNNDKDNRAQTTLHYEREGATFFP